MNNTYSIKETEVIMEKIGQAESVFSLANGKIGVRGFHEESESSWYEASIYMNGFYDSEPYIYGENAYGYAKNKQKMLSLPNMLAVEFQVDGEQFDISTSKVVTYSRVLDMERAEIRKQYVWLTKSGINVNIMMTKIVSASEPSLILTQIECSADQACTLTIKSKYGVVVENTQLDGHDPRLGNLTKKAALHHLETQRGLDNLLTLSQYKTDASGLLLSCGMAHCVEGDKPTISNVENDVLFAFSLSAGKQIRLTKYMYYSDEAGELATHKVKFLALVGKPFSCYQEKQYEIYKTFWERQQLNIEENEKLLGALRFNVFNLYQHVGKDGKANICAKGLSGEGYEGHYFWDTEIYVLPFFTYTMPTIAKALLMSRYRMLDAAKRRASELSYKGALYAWRTINGEEASAYYPAGTAQIHINADIAYAIEQYYHATQDDDFMRQYGLEMLTEIARFYASYADYVKGKGWSINGVTGPDEYHALTNNNAYTNLMVKRQFKKLLNLQKKFGSSTITDEEQSIWQAIAEGLLIKKEGLLTAQDDNFFERTPWDFKERPLRPLLIHYHPMIIYKHQVLKQADLVLGMLLCHEEFSEEERKANYAFYEPLTTHDSSLSETIHGIIAASIGKEEEAYEYLQDTVLTDLYNTHHNTEAGLHMAAMAGGWQSFIFGFGGMRVYEDRIIFHPSVSKELKSYSFSVQFRGVTIELNMKDGVANVTQEKEIPGICVLIEKWQS